VYAAVTAGATSSEPLVALAPLHAPEAVHPVVLLDVQVSVDDWPATMLAGVAARVTEGALGVGMGVGVGVGAGVGVGVGVGVGTGVGVGLRWRKASALVLAAALRVEVSAVLS
jgi:hypothetical protein